MERQKNIVGFLGTHIEMKDMPREDYPIDATYQPNEKDLLLTPSDLRSLHSSLTKMDSKLVIKALENAIIYPIK